jgi:hypothetical protein
VNIVFNSGNLTVQGTHHVDQTSRELQLVLEERVPLSQTSGFLFAHRGDAYSFFAAKRSCCAPRSRHFCVSVASNAPTAVFQGGFFLEVIHGSSSRIPKSIGLPYSPSPTMITA